MQLKPIHLEKADQALQDALTKASGEEMLCVIFLLDHGLKDPTPPPPVSNFPSRAEWRKAIVEKNLKRMWAAVSGTLDDLRALGLDPRGWELGQAVVDAPASAISAAIELRGVELAVLDWEFELPEIVSLSHPPAVSDPVSRP